MREEIADSLRAAGMTILILAASTLLVWVAWLAVNSIGIAPTAALGLVVGPVLVVVGRRMG